MREKIKGNMKRIIPVLMCFMLIFGSCLSVNASSSNYSIVKISSNRSFIYSAELNDGCIYETRINFTLDSANDDVYAFLAFNEINNDPGVLVFSFDSYVYSYEATTIRLKENTSCTYSDHYESYEYSENGKSPITYTNKYGTKIFCNGGREPLTIMSIPTYPELEFSNLPVITLKHTSGSAAYLYDYIVPALINGDVNVEVPNLQYNSVPSALIAPPQNVSIYRGYSNADKQYKFQLQWDKPIDTDLNVEVMFNIHYKDGPLGLGSHIYVKYPHIKYNDGYSAQSNKLQYLEDDLLRSYFQSKEMDLPSVYNITEIYVRFSKEIDGVINYSLWRKIEYLNLDEGNGFDASEDDFDAESSTGAFDTSDNWVDQSVSNGEIVNGSDKENAKAPGIDINGDNVTDVTTPIVNPNIWDSDLESVFGSFKNAIKSAITFVGEFPSMVSEFFGFLPPWVVGCISIGLVMAVLLRLLGR